MISVNKFVRYEPILRKIIFWSSVFLIIFLLFDAITRGLFSAENVSIIQGGNYSEFQFRTESNIKTYTFLRNIIYLLLIIYTLIVSYIGNKLRKKILIKQYLKRVFGLWLFLILSYAIASLIVDLIIVGIALVAL